MKNGDDITSSSSSNAIKIKNLLSSSMNMITTTEITNKQNNFRKILYQGEKDRERERERERNRDRDLQHLQQFQQQRHLFQSHFNSNISPSSNGNSNNNNNNINVDTLDDDEDRLVIDLNDEHEIKSTKSLPMIDTGNLKKESTRRSNIDLNFRRENNQNDMPKIIYLTSDSESSSNSSVKIDILTPVGREKLEQRNAIHHRLPPQRRMTVDDRQILNLSRNEKHSNELETISNEIDNLINYKSDSIVRLLQEYNNDRICATEFAKKMKICCDITHNDLNSLTRTLVKKHHFQLNKFNSDLSKMKYLNFPTTATDLVGYFESVRQHLNKQDFLNTMKFFRLIIKELLNLNKSKIVQYLSEFLIVRKNSNADVLNLSCPKNVIKRPIEQQQPASAFSRILPKPLAQKPENLNDLIFKQCDSNLFYINRTNLIYTQCKSNPQTNSQTKYVCKIRPSCKEQKRSKISPILQAVSSSSAPTTTSTVTTSGVGSIRVNTTKLLQSPVKNLTNKTVSSTNESDISSNTNHRITNYPLPPVPPFPHRYKPQHYSATILSQTQPQLSPQSTQQQQQVRVQAVPLDPALHSPPSPSTQIAQVPSLYPSALSQQEQHKQVSLQRKLHMKYKQKSPKYIEPIQNHHPYYYPAINPSYFYHPYYYQGFASAHQLPEQPSSDNSTSSMYESSMPSYAYPYRYSYIYQSPVERPDSPPSTNSEHSQSELYYQLTMPISRVNAPTQHTQPIQPQPIYHPAHLASVPYDSLPRSHHQVNNQASDYYKYYYSKNC